MRLRTLLVYLVLLGVAIVQSIAGHTVGARGVMPDAVLVLVVCWGLLRGSEEGMVWGLLGGLNLGLLSGAPFGAHAILLILVGFLSGLGERSPFRSQLLVPLAWVCGATLLYAAGMAVLLRLSGWPVVITPAVTGAMVQALVANALLMVALYWVISHLVVPRAGLRSDF